MAATAARRGVLSRRVGVAVSARSSNQQTVVLFLGGGQAEQFDGREMIEDWLVRGGSSVMAPL